MPMGCYIPLVLDTRMISVVVTVLCKVLVRDRAYHRHLGEPHRQAHIWNNSLGGKRKTLLGAELPPRPMCA